MRNPTLNSLALIAFFGGGLLLAQEFMPDRSAWDFVLIQLLSLMNGIGLCIVLISWINRIRLRGRKPVPLDKAL